MIIIKDKITWYIICFFFLIEAVKMLTLRMPRTKVQQNGSIYMNTYFHLPIKTDHHIIAWKPLIDNERVIHHIVLLGCDKIGKIFLSVSQLSNGFWTVPTVWIFFPFYHICI